VFIELSAGRLKAGNCIGRYNNCSRKIGSVDYLRKGMLNSSVNKALTCFFALALVTTILSSAMAQSSAESPRMLGVTARQMLSQQEQPSLDFLVRAPYVGIGAGASTLDPDTSGLTDIDLDEGDATGFQLTVGMDFTKWVSAEFHAADLGAAEMSDNTAVDYRLLGVSTLLYVGGSRDRFNRRGFNLFGRAGLGYLLDGAEDSAAYERESGGQWILGAGAEYSTRSGFGVRAEGIVYDAEATYLQLGLLYRFATEPGGVSGIADLGVSSIPREEIARAEAARIEATRAEAARLQASAAENARLEAERQSLAEPGISRETPMVLNGVVNGLKFFPGSADLTPAARSALDKVAASLLETPESTARLNVHTDNTQDPEASLLLSQQRALSVARYLVVEKGVRKAMLEARAYGSNRPIATNETAAGRNANARVEIFLEDR